MYKESNLLNCEHLMVNCEKYFANLIIKFLLVLKCKNCNINYTIAKGFNLFIGSEWLTSTYVMRSSGISRTCGIFSFLLDWSPHVERYVYFAANPAWLDQWFQSYSNWKILRTIENKFIEFEMQLSFSDCISKLTINAPDQCSLYGFFGWANFIQVMRPLRQIHQFLA